MAGGCNPSVPIPCFGHALHCGGIASSGSGARSPRLRYAICGALALAIHGHPRATLDIDLLSLGGNAQRIVEAGRSLGFTLSVAPMQFANCDVSIFRVSKPDPGTEDGLSLDVLAVSEAIERQLGVEMVKWDDLAIPTVDRKSLILLKELRGNAQDRADIERLS